MRDHESLKRCLAIHFEPVVRVFNKPDGCSGRGDPIFRCTAPPWPTPRWCGQGGVVVWAGNLKAGISRPVFLWRTRNRFRAISVRRHPVRVCVLCSSLPGPSWQPVFASSRPRKVSCFSRFRYKLCWLCGAAMWQGGACWWYTMINTRRFQGMKFGLCSKGHFRRAYTRTKSDNGSGQPDNILQIIFESSFFLPLFLSHPPAHYRGPVQSFGSLPIPIKSLNIAEVLELW